MPKDLAKEPELFLHPLSNALFECLWFSLFRFPFPPHATAQSFLSVLYCERKTPLHATSKLFPGWSKWIISPANASVLERFRFRFVSWMRSDSARDLIWGERYYVTISRCLRVNFMEIIKTSHKDAVRSLASMHSKHLVQAYRFEKILLSLHNYMRLLSRIRSRYILSLYLNCNISIYIFIQLYDKAWLIFLLSLPFSILSCLF